MSFFDPQTYLDQPYVAGLNQMGHVVLGAAMITLALALMPVPLASLITGAGFGAWEAYQVAKRGAAIWDSFLDLFCCLAGLIAWGLSIQTDLVTGWAIWFPVFVVLIGVAIMVIFATLNRLKTPEKD